MRIHDPALGSLPWSSSLISVARPNSAHLLETDESMKRRSAKPLDHNETTQLKHTESPHAAQEAAHHAESEAKRASDITKKV